MRRDSRNIGVLARTCPVYGQYAQLYVHWADRGDVECLQVVDDVAKHVEPLLDGELK